MVSELNWFRVEFDEIAKCGNVDYSNTWSWVFFALLSTFGDITLFGALLLQESPHVHGRALLMYANPLSSAPPTTIDEHPDGDS